MGRLFSTALVALLPLSLPCRGEIITVDPARRGDYSEIQPAIDAADEGDTVIVKAGEYIITEPILFSRTTKVLNLVVRSESGPEHTTIRMSGSPAEPLRASVVSFESGEPQTVILEGFTITGGSGIGDGGGQGGGVHCTESSPTLRNCWISGNSARRGGGIACLEFSSPRLVECQIVNNSTAPSEILGFGGGVFCKNGSAPILENSVISRNTSSSSGGGIYCSIGSSAVLNGCVVADNVALTMSGGGVACEESSPTFTDCTIERNTAFGGGGVDAVCARPNFINCTLRDNHAVEGGGARCNNAFPTFINCTFSGNSANFVGGLSCAADPSFCAYSGDTTVNNCIVWGNSGGSLAAFRDATITVSYSCIGLNPTSSGSRTLWYSEGIVFADGNLFEDPLFCGWEGDPDVYVDSSNTRLGDGTQASPYRELRSALSFSLGLRLDSPCIGAGEGGRNMGADNGLCAGDGGARRRIHLGEGRYQVKGLSLARGVSLFGADKEGTILEGTVLGLSTGAVLADVTVTGGTPTGGVVIRDGQSPELLRCVISGNWSWTGGGGVACLDGASPTLRDCQIIGNVAGTEDVPKYGGGVLCADFSSPTLINCVISENVGTSNGGAIYCRNECAPTLINCVLSGNRGRHGGAGFFHEGSLPEFVNCTITGNWVVSTGRGGGLFSLGAPVTLINSIVWNNRGGSIEDTTAVEATYSCIEGEKVMIGEGNINVDPLFIEDSDWEDSGTPQDFTDDVAVEGDSRLRPDSPCIDSGTLVESLAMDIEGIGRPCGAAYDMGAFESGGCAPPPPPPLHQAQFRRGDTNADAVINVSDGLLILRFLFLSGEAQPACEDAADADDSGTLDLSDAVQVFLFLFSPAVEQLAGPRSCGPDPTEDDLECGFFPDCG